MCCINDRPTVATTKSSIQLAPWFMGWNGTPWSVIIRSTAFARHLNPVSPKPPHAPQPQRPMRSPVKFISDHPISGSETVVVMQTTKDGFANQLARPFHVQREPSACSPHPGAWSMAAAATTSRNACMMAYTSETSMCMGWTALDLSTRAWR